MHDGLDDVRTLLPGVRLDHPEQLGGSDRSEVRRIRAMFPDGLTRSLIVKTFTGAEESWVRESSALSVAAPGTPTARLVAEASSPPIVVMTDVGPGASVADALLGADPDRAAEAVLLWARTIATMHSSSLGSRQSFRSALAARSGDLPVTESRMSLDIDDAVRLLADRCLQLDVAMPPGAMAELHELPRRLDGNGAAAISPTDACPDNNVRVRDDLVLVDFEGAQWRHVAWDVAYLTVPWPSCWCSWRMPADVAERAVERYRATIEHALPYVRTPQFRRDVAAAALGWALVSTSWFLTKALDEDPPQSDPAKRTPTRRAMILHRLEGARRASELPAAAELAGRLREVLAHRWGELPLAFAPAFDPDV